MEGSKRSRSAVVFDVEHFATKDGPGIRTVFFLKGCPLRCMWCHNPESINPAIESYPDGTVIGRERTVEDVLAEALQDRDFYAASGGGLTVSGGEPLFRWEFVRALFARAKEEGVSTAIETSGYAPPAAVEALACVTDIWLYDVKGLDAAKHKAQIGVDNAAILRNLRWLDAHGARIVLRCPMIPGVNDSAENLAALGRLADELACVDLVEVEPYVPYGIEKARRLGMKVYEAPRPPAEYGPSVCRRLAAQARKPVRLA